MDKAKFKVFPGGPLELSGSFEITGIDGKVIESGEVVYLCRCGGSHNKPFCDGTHKKIGFSG
jgi:CDGSH-type Zn-finger protein